MCVVLLSQKKVMDINTFKSEPKRRSPIWGVVAYETLVVNVCQWEVMAGNAHSIIVLPFVCTVLSAMDMSPL